MHDALGKFITLLIIAFCVNRDRGLAAYLFDMLIAQEHDTFCFFRTNRSKVLPRIDCKRDLCFFLLIKCLQTVSRASSD